MPWSFEGPASNQLGYDRHGRPDMGEAPRRTAEKHPVRTWISIAAVVLAVFVFCFFAVVSMRRSDRYDLAERMAGTWLQSGSVGSILVFAKPPGAGRAELPAFTGEVDGHEVRGVVTMPAYPSLSKVLRVDLLGRTWDVSFRRHYMTLTNDAGREISFSRI
jgi:hypothetical protein